MIEYHINEVDKQLEILLKLDREYVLECLDSSLMSEETSLELIITSIRHCKRQICNIDKLIIKKPQGDRDRISLMTKKTAFEDNLLIWNLCGHIQITSYQIKSIQKRLYSDENELQKRITVGEASLLIYESSKIIIDSTGKSFLDYLTRILGSDKLCDFKSLRKELTIYRENNSNNLKNIRVKNVAHRDPDLLNQIDVIEDFNWSDCIQLLLDYEQILNKLGAFLNSIIPLGLEQLAVAFK